MSFQQLSLSPLTHVGSMGSMMGTVVAASAVTVVPAGLLLFFCIFIFYHLAFTFDSVFVYPTGRPCRTHAGE